MTACPSYLSHPRHIGESSVLIYPARAKHISRLKIPPASRIFSVDIFHDPLYYAFTSFVCYESYYMVCSIYLSTRKTTGREGKI